jgi:amidase
MREEALAGVPVVVKESFGVAGRPCTWGIPALKHTRAPANSTAVQRLLDAGAVLMGATNVPFELMDGQSYRPRVPQLRPRRAGISHRPR